MKRTLNILAGLAAAVAIVALLAPASFAQCPQAREFGALAGGKTSSKINIDVSGFTNTNNESAQFWQTGVPANGTGVGAAGSCHSQGADIAIAWWQSLTDPGLRGIRGFVAQVGCTLPVCPESGASLTFLVEDVTADGQGAGFVMYTTDETPQGARWYDHARTDPAAAEGSVALHAMGSFPDVVILGSAGPPPNTTVSGEYNDVGILFHGVQGAGDTQLPGSAQITTYDVMSASGGDPGRARSGWTLEHKIPYSDAAIIGDSVNVPCTGDVPTVLAIGITFDGSVESVNVGAASLPVNCDPGIADPDMDTPKVRRPSYTSRPSRSGR